MLRTGEIGQHKGGLRGSKRARQIGKGERKERSRKGVRMSGLNVGTVLL